MQALHRAKRSHVSLAIARIVLGFTRDARRWFATEADPSKAANIEALEN
jgi:hypothetical protein